MNETLKQVLLLISYFVSALLIYLCLRYLDDRVKAYFVKKEMKGGKNGI